MQRLAEGWTNTVSAEDYVIIPGDISWATYLEQALDDFRFIESMPGTKIISKGNHDYWWTTLSKLNRFVAANGFNTIKFMHNNSYAFEGMVLCGTRGWQCPGDDNFSGEDDRIFKRELQRLELSLRSIRPSADDEVIVALHYPPFNSRKEPSEFIDIMNRYGVGRCLYGHLHGESCRTAVEDEVHGIRFNLISADYLGFTPIRIK